MSYPDTWGSLRERRGDGHLFSVMLRVGVGLNSTGDSDDEASSCWELRLGAWARLEVGVGLKLTDLKLLVQGMQGVTKRVGLKKLGTIVIGRG